MNFYILFRYYMHHLPSWVHKFSTLASLIVEMPVTCLILIPMWQYRIFGLVNFIGLMVMISIVNNDYVLFYVFVIILPLILEDVTGNYGHLGLLTSVISLSLLDDWMVDSFISPPSSLYLFPEWSNPLTLYLTFAFILVYPEKKNFP